MELTKEKHGKYLVVQASGRLDASWADFFTDALSGYVLEGNHQLIIDAAGLSFLSSAGIRSLLSIYRKLDAVSGSFLIIHAQPPIANTLSMTGFKSWLAAEIPEEIDSAVQKQSDIPSGETEIYTLDPEAGLSFSLEADWEPWQVFEQVRLKRMTFPHAMFALGIGGEAAPGESPAVQFGDFLAMEGQVIFQPPAENARPDFLLAEEEFVPELSVLQALCCRGEMSHLVRFAPAVDPVHFDISDISGMVLGITKSEAAAFVLLAEIEGLVGANLIRSPGIKTGSGNIPFPAIRDWVSFTGERAFHGKMALIFGIISRTESRWKKDLLNPLPSNPAISGHFHAAVFHDLPIPNGKLDLLQNVKRLFNGPAPLALMHLVDDNRPLTGLGQSAFIRGACWCSAIKDGKEEAL
jgi:anti-anti-sigma factor